MRELTAVFCCFALAQTQIARKDGIGNAEKMG